MKIRIRKIYEKTRTALKLMDELAKGELSAKEKGWLSLSEVEKGILMWKDVNTNEDMKELMDAVCCFHDGCIKEMHYISGAYVGEGLEMHPLNDKRILRVVIQRQLDYPSMLELEFSGLQYINLHPVDPTYTCEIIGSTMLIKNGLIYWCDDESVDMDSIENYKDTLICAEKLSWRPIDGHMGKEDYYVTNV